MSDDEYTGSLDPKATPGAEVREEDERARERYREHERTKRQLFSSIVDEAPTGRRPEAAKKLLAYERHLKTAPPEPATTPAQKRAAAAFYGVPVVVDERLEPGEFYLRAVADVSKLPKPAFELPHAARMGLVTRAAPEMIDAARAYTLRYPVHKGCGGEVVRTGLELGDCHGCGRKVPRDDTVTVLEAKGMLAEWAARAVFAQIESKG